MRRDQQRLSDILEALDWIAKSIADRTEAEFLADETLCYTVAQRLTVIGEAVARLTPAITARHNSVPWPDIVALRNILVHEYFGIHWPLVWQTAFDHAPVLRVQIAKYGDRRDRPRGAKTAPWAKPCPGRMPEQKVTSLGRSRLSPYFGC